MNHPGVELENEMNKCGMSRKELAIRTGVTEKHICTVINGDRGISANFASKLGYVFDDAKYWLNLQKSFDEEQIKIREENEISQEELNILKNLHDIMTHLIECGYITNNCGQANKVIQMRKFLNVSNLTIIPKITYNAAYRAQLSTNVKVDPYVLFAWQRLCEKKTENLPIANNLDLKKLSQSLNQIKSTMFGDINNGVQDLQKIFAECGIAFQVVKNFKGAPVQGFIKKTLDNRLILCLTIRRQRADTFWFTLFHEIGHILNGDYANRFVDFEAVSSKAEALADQFASDILIDQESYKDFIMSDQKLTWERIEKFAESMHIQPFIVLGRLQNDHILDWSDYAGKIVKYSWA